MKKYWMLFSVTGILSLAILLTGAAIKGGIKKVEVLSLAPLAVENTVTCSGRVERADSKNIYLQSNSIVEDIYVQEGQLVSAGDKLLTVSGRVERMNSAPETDYSQYYNSYASPEEAYSDYLSGKLTLPSGEEGEESYVSNGKYTDVTAPIDGVVTSIAVQTNGAVNTGQTVMTISTASDLQVCLSVNESQISSIQVGQQAEITGVGFKNTTYYGTVRSISSEAKQIVGTTGQETIVEVIVSVDTEGDDIKPGFTAKCKIITSEEENLLIVPYEAVRADENGAEYVYLSVNGRAEKRYITTGKEYEKGFQVTEGLSVGDAVLMTPEGIDDRDRLMIVQEGVVQDNV